MESWYVVRITYSLTPEGHIQFVHSKHAGPFDDKQQAKKIADEETGFFREHEYNDEFFVGTEDDINKSGLVA